MLSALMATAIKNCGKKTKGYRYKDKSVLKFAAFVNIVSGPYLYEIFQRNLGFPSASTIRPIISQVSAPFLEGVFRFKDLKSYLEAHNAPMTIWIGEDATRIIARVEYDRNLNKVVGFVPPLDVKNGCPSVSGFEASSAKAIQNYFATCPKSNYAYVVMAQPLTDAIPAFCLCIFGTNNVFTATDVLNRFTWLIEQLQIYGIYGLGFSADADTRLLRAMRSMAFPPPDKLDNPLMYHGWFVQFIKQLILYIQDTMHIGTKLRTRLLKASIVLAMGGSVVSPTHLKILIQEMQKLEHCLTEKDLQGADKMNFAAVERMTHKRVLELLDKVPGASGTKCYLEMVGHVLNAFLDKSITPTDRIYQAWKAMFFFRLWRLWLKENGYSTSKNFITSSTYFCLELNAHALIAVMRRLRSLNKPELFLPWLFSSQCNEKYFREMRSFTPTFSTVVNVTMKGLLARSHKTQLKSELTYDLQDAVTFPRERRKCIDASNQASFLASQGLPGDTEICAVVKNARAAAISRARELGMTPKFDPVVPPIPLHVYELKPKKKKAEVVTEDRLGEELPSDLVDDIHEDAILSSLTSEKICDSLDPPPTSPFVMYLDPNGKKTLIRKSTLCWMLDSGTPNLSSDRLVRVKTQDHIFNMKSAHQAVESVSKKDFVNLGEWCAFLDDESDVLIGIILSFSYLTGKGKSTDYSAKTAPTKAPVSNAKGLGCLCTWFEPTVTGVLKPFPTRHEYCDIKKYVCSLPPPQKVDGVLRYSPMILSQMNTNV